MSDAAADSKEGARLLGALTIGLFVVSALAVVYAVHGSMPTNPVALPAEDQANTIAWIPEAWKFFTRNPQEENTLLFVKRDGAWVTASPVGADVRWAFGLNRAGRGVWIESSLLVEGAPSSLFTSCETEVASCLEASTKKPIEVENKSPQKYLCGDVAVVLRKPAPWAWARDGHPPTMPSRFIRLSVRC